MADYADEDVNQEDDDLGLDDFRGPPDDQGVSLDQLSQAYAELINRGDDPYQEPATELEEEDEAEPAHEPGEPAAETSVEVTPQSIVEAILFVGTPDNSVLTSDRIASLMRGVRPQEVDDLVRELNQSYVAEGCPYTIVSEGAGYRMVLRDEFAPLRDKFYGRIRDARLSQAAVDVLAIVAYHQPLTREEVEQLRGRPSGKILSQLVRRQLLRVERTEEKPRKKLYETTQRFLDLFGLETLDDLPQSQDLDRVL